MKVNKLISLYLDVNYAGQKIGNPWNVKEGLVNIILMKLSIISSGLFIGLLLLIGLRSKLLLLVLLLTFVLFIWRTFKKKLHESKIDFSKLELRYTQLNKKIRLTYFIVSMAFLIISIFLMIYSIKWVLMLR